MAQKSSNDYQPWKRNRLGDQSLDTPEPHDIEDAIREAQSILDLRDDWDEAGSVAYAESTLNRAIDFLRHNALSLWESCCLRVPAPVIGPGPDGSIDIHWKTSARTLLVNIKADSSKPASFYGDDRVTRHDSANNVIEGHVDISVENLWLMMWLAK